MCHLPYNVEVKTKVTISSWPGRDLGGSSQCWKSAAPGSRVVGRSLTPTSSPQAERTRKWVPITWLFMPSLLLSLSKYACTKGEGAQRLKCSLCKQQARPQNPVNAGWISHSAWLEFPALEGGDRILWVSCLARLAKLWAVEQLERPCLSDYEEQWEKT